MALLNSSIVFSMETDQNLSYIMLDEKYLDDFVEGVISDARNYLKYNETWADPATPKEFILFNTATDKQYTSLIADSFDKMDYNVFWLVKEGKEINRDYIKTIGRKNTFSIWYFIKTEEKYRADVDYYTCAAYIPTGVHPIEAEAYYKKREPVLERNKSTEYHDGVYYSYIEFVFDKEFISAKPVFYNDGSRVPVKIGLIRKKGTPVWYHKTEMYIKEADYLFGL